MSATEWIGASHVTRSACGSRIGPRLVGQRGILEPRVGKPVDDPPVERRVRRVVDDGAGVLALEVDRVDAAQLDELARSSSSPVGRASSLNCRPGVVLEDRADALRRGRIAKSTRDDERDRARLAAHGVPERHALLPQREVERGALERPAAVVEVGVLRRLAVEQRLAGEVPRERAERPRTRERQYGATFALRARARRRRR